MSTDETVTLGGDLQDLLDWFPQEELLPELAGWLCDGPMGQALKHPLVFDIVYVPQMAGRLNQAYRAKKEYLAEAEAEGNWDRYVFTHERAYRSYAIDKIRLKVSDHEQYWKLLHNVWVDTENLRQWGEPLIKRLLEADRPGRSEHFMSQADREELDALPDKVTIYRGFNHVSWWGWSWTTDEAKAEWFAKRFENHLGPAQVASAVVAKSKIIAFLGNRGESEVIINPRRLPKKVEVREL